MSDKPWDKEVPSKGGKMTPAQVSKAKAKARAAGRPYPNLVDNMAAMKEDAEAHSTDKNKPSSRFDASDELVNVYKKDTPGQSKTLKAVKKVVEEVLYECNGSCTCGKKKEIEEKKEYENPTGGLSQRGREHYNRTTGSHLQAPVTTKPSKLKKGTRAHSRRKSFCARMGGMKKRLTSAETARDPDSRINKALRKWNC
jgi:hypothetical protein